MVDDSARDFEQRHGLRLVAKLGDGKDGVVFQSDRHTAVKFLYGLDIYTRELFLLLRGARCRMGRGEDRVLLPQFVKSPTSMLPTIRR